MSDCCFLLCTSCLISPRCTVCFHTCVCFFMLSYISTTSPSSAWKHSIHPSKHSGNVPSADTFPLSLHKWEVLQPLCFSEIYSLKGVCVAVNYGMAHPLKAQIIMWAQCQIHYQSLNIHGRISTWGNFWPYLFTHYGDITSTKASGHGCHHYSKLGEPPSSEA